MARIFVTASADGLGQMAARLMLADGHRVVLHARNETRTKETLAAVSGAEIAVAGDLSSIAECRQIAAQVNALGAFDAALAAARKWPDVLSNALEPGWVATKMGGPGAPDDLDAGPKTQVWLATSNAAEAMVSGQYFYHQKRRAPEPAARDEKIQERLIAECARISGVSFTD
jgi:NAD(P)-dependent dehydrogenase (short-subunit alcohol dehydrogenase family)